MIGEIANWRQPNWFLRSEFPFWWIPFEVDHFLFWFVEFYLIGIVTEVK